MLGEVGKELFENGAYSSWDSTFDNTVCKVWKRSVFGNKNWFAELGSSINGNWFYKSH